MIELGELEAHHAQFAQRGVQVVAISDDDLATAQQTQANFPHLMIVSDAGQALAKQFQMLHPGASQTGDDTNAPTTVLVDQQGVVQGFLRAASIMDRPAPEQLLQTIEQRLGPTGTDR